MTHNARLTLTMLTPEGVTSHVTEQHVEMPELGDSSLNLEIGAAVTISRNHLPFFGRLFGPKKPMELPVRIKMDVDPADQGAE